MITDPMLIDNGKKGGKSVVVVLNGIKVSTEKNGIAPLKCALRDVVVAQDEVLVITIFNWEACTPSPANYATYCCLLENRNYHQGGGQRDSTIRFFHEEITRRTETCMNIYSQYIHDKCKSIGVKFDMKTETDFELPSSAIIVKEAKSAGATWIIMDRCFEGDTTTFNNFSEINCNISFVGDDEEHCCTLPNLEDSYQPSDPSLVASTSKEGEILEDDNISSSSKVFSMVEQALGMPLQLTWEVISEITDGFRETVEVGENYSFRMFGGYLSEKRTQIVVKRFIGDFGAVLEAEKKAAVAMYHKNILRLLGYHKNENATVLVFPYTGIGSLDKYLRGQRRENPKIAFEDSMKIAIGIAQGLQYMHEECPRGPVVHGNLRPCNIFLRNNLQPQISGFGQATWLQLDQSSLISSHRHKRCKHGNNLDPASQSLMTKDIFAFGILLLRLFCRRSASLGNKQLVEWARPLLLKRAYLELFDGDAEQLDPYEAFRVTCAAAQCIKTRQSSRPSMCKVVSWLKGEVSCAVEASPSPECTPNGDLNMYTSESVVDLYRRNLKP